MQAVHILAEEHRSIESVLVCLERLLERTAQTDSLDCEAAAEILEFLELFADGSHQDKEEQVVFPKLLENTTDSVRSFIEQLFEEHVEERRALERLRSNLVGAAYGDALSRDLFVSLGRAYCRMLSQHASWEDECLLPLMEKYVGERQDAELVAGYGVVDECYFTGACRGPRELLARIHAHSGATELAV